MKVELESNIDPLLLMEAILNSMRSGKTTCVALDIPIEDNRKMLTIETRLYDDQDLVTERVAISIFGVNLSNRKSITVSVDNNGKTERRRFVFDRNWAFVRFEDNAD